MEWNWFLLRTHPKSEWYMTRAYLHCASQMAWLCSRSKSPSPEHNNLLMREFIWDVNARAHTHSNKIDPIRSAMMSGRTIAKTERNHDRPSELSQQPQNKWILYESRLLGGRQPRTARLHTHVDGIFHGRKSTEIHWLIYIRLDGPPHTLVTLNTNTSWPGDGDGDRRADFNVKIFINTMLL